MKIPGILFLATCLFACTSAEDDQVLQQPPFAALTDSIDDAPSNANLFYRRANLLLQNEQETLAEKDFRKAWELAPNEDHAIGVARFLIRRNNDSAIAFLEKAIQEAPESLILQISLARGYQQKKNYPKALAICDRIINDYPNQLDALLLRAELLKAENRNAEALATLEQAYSYAPFDAELAHSLAFDYAEAKNPKALVLTDSLIRADSLQRHAEPFYFKGLYFANTGNRVEALQQFEAAIRRDYNFLDAHMEKGILLFESQQLAAAQKAFELAITISPALADAHLWLGKVARAQHRNADANLHFQRAFALDKSLTEAKAAADAL